jgi:hypothetical protein
MLNSEFFNFISLSSPSIDLIFQPEGEKAGVTTRFFVALF